MYKNNINNNSNNSLGYLVLGLITGAYLMWKGRQEYKKLVIKEEARLNYLRANGFTVIPEVDREHVIVNESESRPRKEPDNFIKITEKLFSDIRYNPEWDMSILDIYSKDPVIRVFQSKNRINFGLEITKDMISESIDNSYKSRRKILDLIMATRKVHFPRLKSLGINEESIRYRVVNYYVVSTLSTLHNEHINPSDPTTFHGACGQEWVTIPDSHLKLENYHADPNRGILNLYEDYYRKDKKNLKMIHEYIRSVLNHDVVSFEVDTIYSELMIYHFTEEGKEVENSIKIFKYLINHFNTKLVDSDFDLDGISDDILYHHSRFYLPTEGRTLFERDVNDFTAIIDDDADDKFTLFYLPSDDEE